MEYVARVHLTPRGDFSTGAQRRRSLLRQKHHANNKRCIFHYGYRDASALPATKGDGAVTFTNEPDAIRQVTFTPLRKGNSYEHPGRRFFGSVT